MENVSVPQSISVTKRLLRFTKMLHVQHFHCHSFRYRAVRKHWGIKVGRNVLRSGAQEIVWDRSRVLSSCRDISCHDACSVFLLCYMHYRAFWSSCSGTV